MVEYIIRFEEDENGVFARRMEEVVRCQDCVNRGDDSYCSHSGHQVLPDGFCSKWERKDLEDNNESN